MLRTALLALTLAAAGCGGASPPAPVPVPTPTPTPTAGTALELWAPVLQPGAVFTFEESLPDELREDGPTVVVATVTAVEEVEGGRAARISWTVDGEPMEVTNMPVVIVVGDAGVTFYGDADSFAARDPEADTFPAAAAPAKLPGGLYVDPGDDGALCYGYGPEDDAGECEDVCFSQLCVHPTLGLTGGEGRWWPDWSVFHRRGG